MKFHIIITNYNKLPDTEFIGRLEYEAEAISPNHDLVSIVNFFNNLENPYSILPIIDQLQPGEISERIVIAHDDTNLISHYRIVRIN